MLLSPSDLQILARLEQGLTQSQIGNDLGLEQPAVSKAIRTAEQRLGMTLAYTDGRRLKIVKLAIDGEPVTPDSAPPALAQRPLALA